MVIFRRTRGPEGNVISGRRGPVISSPSRDKEPGRVKVIIGLIKIIIGLSKVREEIKALREVISFFTRDF